ncbi:MAG: hypothetical protein ABIJ34_08055 [archaeon]
MSENNPFFEPKISGTVLEIEQEDIFKEFSDEDLAEFVKEFYFVFNVLALLDQDYGQLDNSQTGKNLKKFKLMIKDWNKKYKDLLLDFQMDGISCKLKVFFDDDLPHLALLLKKMQRFIGFTKFSNEKLNAVFKEGTANDENSLTVHNLGNRVELIYSKEDVQDPKSPEFRLCAYYALKNGFDKSINLNEKYENTFSFISETIFKDGWNSRWNVRFGR